MNTHEAFVNFGKHKGERITRLPPSYLRWAMNTECDAQVYLPNMTRYVAFHEAAQAELARRGERMGDVEISGHAVDSFSARFLDYYQENRRPRMENGDPEGLYTFMERQASHIINFTPGFVPDNPREGEKKEVEFEGIKWAFQVDLAVPVLLTVVRARRQEARVQGGHREYCRADEPMEDAAPWE